MKNLYCSIFFILIVTESFSQKVDKELLSEFADNACHCIDSISVYDKARQEVAKEISACIDKQMSAYQLLAREDLPSFSNWWGGLLVPLLAWFLSYRVQKRIYRGLEKKIKRNKPTRFCTLRFFWCAAIWNSALHFFQFWK